MNEKHTSEPKQKHQNETKRTFEVMMAAKKAMDEFTQKEEAKKNPDVSTDEKNKQKSITKLLINELFMVQKRAHELNPEEPMPQIREGFLLSEKEHRDLIEDLKEQAETDESVEEILINLGHIKPKTKPTYSSPNVERAIRGLNEAARKSKRDKCGDK